MSTLIGHDETEMDPIVNLELTIPIIDDDDKKTDYEISLSLEKKKSANLPPVRTPSTVWQHYEKVDKVVDSVLFQEFIASFNSKFCVPSQFPHPHTGLQIQKAIYKIFQDFSITTKALAITIDNDANQVAAMRLLSTTLSDELQIDFKIIRCGAHSIVLVVNAGLGKFKPIIDKVQAFIIEVRKSPKKEQELITFATNLNVKYKKLIRDVKTRWNSTFLMLESFLNNKAVIVSLISIGSNFAKLDLNDDEWKELQLFCDFLNPFFEFTEEMSDSKYPTFGTLLLLLDHLLEHITIIKNDTSIPK
ncbi:unnamed protein product [Rhizophagus irregularis]|nr:unnamed protein product [Rhizophagus irregularis]